MNIPIFTWKNNVGDDHVKSLQTPSINMIAMPHLSLRKKKCTKAYFIAKTMTKSLLINKIFLIKTNDYGKRFISTFKVSEKQISN